MYAAFFHVTVVQRKSFLDQEIACRFLSIFYPKMTTLNSVIQLDYFCCFLFRLNVSVSKLADFYGRVIRYCFVHDTSRYPVTQCYKVIST